MLISGTLHTSRTAAVEAMVACTVKTGEGWHEPSGTAVVPLMHWTQAVQSLPDNS